MKKKSIILIGLSLAIIAFVVWYSQTSKKDVTLDGKKDLTVQLQWFDGAQFCGLYVAQEKGYFIDEGLNVTLNPIAGFTSDPIAILLDNSADIAIAPADRILISKNNGKEIKAFGTVFNRSLACYTMKVANSTDTLNLKMLENAKIGVYKKFDTENILLSLIKKHNLNIDSKNIIQAPQDALGALINNDIQALGSYIINEPLQLNENGKNVKYIDPVKHGVTFYSDTYITTSDIWNNKQGKLDRNDLKKFIRASNKGWEYCKNNPEEAIEIMFKTITNKNKTDNGKFELLSLKKAIEFVGGGKENIPGVMDEKIWLNMEEALYNIGRIEQKGYIADLCDFKLIQEAINEK